MVTSDEAPGPHTEVVDLRGDIKPPETKPIPSPEHTRQRLATVLVWLFAIEMGKAILLIAVYPIFGLSIENIREVLLLIISPTVALVGSVTGFYFGTKSEADRETGRRTREAARNRITNSPREK